MHCRRNLATNEILGPEDPRDPTGIIFDLKRFSTDDGPGIRTTVFVKGCGLNCLWCHSPESISAAPQLLFYESRCIRCGGCVSLCPRGAQRITVSGERILDRSLCDGCGLCAEACPSGSLEISGRRMAASQVVEEVAADVPFYVHSGGGVTVSGGEPARQASFVEAILRGCRERDISTALDTSGYPPWSAFSRLMPYVDLFLFDVKHLDPAAHRRLTGCPNDPILRNLRQLSGAGARVQVRVPLIPGLTDSPEEVAATAAFCRKIGIKSLALLPYNGAAGSKYLWIGRHYALEGLLPQPEECLAALLEAARGQGIDVQLGG